MPGHPFEHGFDLRLVPEMLEQPFRWTASRRIFVNSMSDLFHEDIPDEYILKVASVMVKANWHVYQVLTKRAARMAHLLRTALCDAACQSHIWWGVSVENQRVGVPRIEMLRSAPAAVRFLSIEPLLEDLGHLDLHGINWVIVGGESGPGARPMAASWVRSIRDQSQRARVPFFFKQWGGVNKSQRGRELDGRTYSAFPRHAKGCAPSAATRQVLLASMTPA